MTPQLQQAIRLLQLSTLELQTEVQQALEENPMLEQEEENYEAGTDDSESLSAESQTDSVETAEISADAEDPHIDMENQQELPDELAVDASWEDTYDITTATAPTSNQQSSDSGRKSSRAREK